MKSKARFYMLCELREHPQEYLDCGEINITLLAENTAQALDLYVKDDIPEWIFNLSFEIGTKMEGKI